MVWIVSYIEDEGLYQDYPVCLYFGILLQLMVQLKMEIGMGSMGIPVLYLCAMLVCLYFECLLYTSYLSDSN